MDSKQVKRSLIIIGIGIVLLIIFSSFFGERISDFMNGFITGLSLTVITGAIIYFWMKIKKK